MDTYIYKYIIYTYIYIALLFSSYVGGQRDMFSKLKIGLPTEGVGRFGPNISERLSSLTPLQLETRFGGDKTTLDLV